MGDHSTIASTDDESQAQALLEQLSEVKDDEERSLIVTRMYLANLSPDMAAAVQAAAVPHWFDAEILGALHPKIADDAGEIYTAMQDLSFVEQFPDRGSNIHEVTREAILDDLWHTQQDEYKLLARRAADYFQQQNTPEAQMEAIYHLLIADPNSEQMLEALRNVRWHWADGMGPTEYTRVESLANIVQEHGDRLSEEVRDWIKLWQGRATSQNVHQLRRIEQKISFWLEKRGRTREGLERFLEGMYFDKITTQMVDGEEELTASLAVAEYLGINPEALQPRHKIYLPERSYDTGLLNWDEVHVGIKELAEQIIDSDFYPDWLLAVLDPEAPGGVTAGGLLITELIRTYAERGISTPPPVLGTITIEGRVGRPRQVTACTDPPPTAQKVLVIDDVTLSGRTLDLAHQYLNDNHPALEVRRAALFTSEHIARQVSPGKVGCDYYYQETRRNTVIFPWGAVQYTGELNQFFDIPTGERKVTVNTRPWGRYEEFALNEHCTVRILTFYPNQELSFHRHKYRDEFFVALDEGLRLQVGEKIIEPIKGDYVVIPRHVWHRMGTIENWDRPARVLEIAFGNYDQVGDIERKDDRYGRVHLDGSI